MPALAAGREGLSVLGQRLDQLANVLFGLAGVVLLLAVIGAIVGASTEVDTFGLVDESVTESGRSGVLVLALGGGLTAAGVLAGLGGILKALVRRDDL